MYYAVKMIKYKSDFGTKAIQKIIMIFYTHIWLDFHVLFMYIHFCMDVDFTYVAKDIIRNFLLVTLQNIIEK